MNSLIHILAKFIDVYCERITYSGTRVTVISTSWGDVDVNGNLEYIKCQLADFDVKQLYEIFNLFCIEQHCYGVDKEFVAKVNMLGYHINAVIRMFDSVNFPASRSVNDISTEDSK